MRVGFAGFIVPGSTLACLATLLALFGGTGVSRGQAVDGATSIALRADAKATGKPLVHFWSKVVGAGRANEGLRSTWQEELQTAVQYGGFQYVRFHGIFHDDMFVYREDKDGTPVYNFQYVDDLFDRMLANHARPFVELAFSPIELASTPKKTFWWNANGSPPSDYKKWSDLVDHLVRHCIARYGADEVRQWYFEVWNEPNLKGFFDGTQMQYFELYKASAETIKKIDPKLRVGGPATSNFELDKDAAAAAQASGGQLDVNALPWRPVWIPAFLAYCKEHDLPVDFVSTHPYPADFNLDEPGGTKSKGYRRSIDSTRIDLTYLRKLIDASAYPKAEIQLTEWSSTPSPVDHGHDSLAAGAFIAKTNLESIGLVDSLSYWVFTDVFEERRAIDSIFHGGFGLINYQEIVKPAFHAYRMMNELGDELVQQAIGGVVTRKAGKIVALAYNYPPEVKDSLPFSGSLAAADKIDAMGSARDFTLNLSHLPPNARFEVETLDHDHGDAVAAWEAMGKPEPPTREQTLLLRKQAWATKKETIHADAAGKLAFKASLPPWAVMVVRQQ